jgi:hypothetical protein
MQFRLAVFQIYHHVFAFTNDGQWAVVQQGMDLTSGWARRYHWLGEKVDTFILEPHSAVCGEPVRRVLNMVAGESAGARDASLYLAGKPDEVVKTLKKITDMPVDKLKVLSLPAGHPPGRAGLKRPWTGFTISSRLLTRACWRWKEWGRPPYGPSPWFPR